MTHFNRVFVDIPVERLNEDSRISIASFDAEFKSAKKPSKLLKFIDGL
jgi:hypothetical protein